MIHLARLRLCTTDKRQSCCQLHLWKHLLHILLHADTVLDQHHQRVFFQERWQKFGQQTIVHRLQPDQHHVTLRHVARSSIGIHMWQMKTAVARIHLQTTLLHILIVAVGKEMHLLARMCQLRSIKATDGTHSNHSVSHLSLLFWGTKVVKTERRTK